MLVAPFDVMDTGRMAVYFDPAGAPSACGSRGHAPAPGVRRARLADLERADDPRHRGREAFYGAVFGWTAEEQADGRHAYTVWQVRAAGVAGMMSMAGGKWPADLPRALDDLLRGGRLRRDRGPGVELGGRVVRAADHDPAGPVRGRAAIRRAHSSRSSPCRRPTLAGRLARARQRRHRARPAGRARPRSPGPGRGSAWRAAPR